MILNVFSLYVVVEGTLTLSVPDALPVTEASAGFNEVILYIKEPDVKTVPMLIPCMRRVLFAPVKVFPASPEADVMVSPFSSKNLILVKALVPTLLRFLENDANDSPLQPKNANPSISVTLVSSIC